jgi:hypothetical protein
VVTYIIVLSEDVNGNLPDGNDAAAYAKATDVYSIPVTADPTAEVVLKATPWDAQARPGKCVLTPAMEMLYCYVGANDTNAFNAIKMHAGQ